MMDLQESNYVDDFHAKIFASLVYQTTAKAKIETDPEKAFILSDFSYDLVRMVSSGINLLKNGA